MKLRTPKKPTHWTAEELRYWKRLSSPFAIQTALDSFSYRAESVYCSPRQVIRERRAHCFDGALFAAAGLRQLGHPPLILDLRSAENDDDHVIALFRSRNSWGAIGKSNYVALAWREPIYRNLRELAMSYFEMYFNLAKEKTLREYSRPLNLTPYNKHLWMYENTILEEIAEVLDRHPHYRLITSAQIRSLQKTDERTFRAGTLGTNKKGCYRL